MLTKVDPLRNELQSLEIEAQASRIKVRKGYFNVIGGDVESRGCSPRCCSLACSCVHGLGHLGGWGEIMNGLIAAARRLYVPPPSPPHSESQSQRNCHADWCSILLSNSENWGWDWRMCSFGYDVDWKDDKIYQIKETLHNVIHVCGYVFWLSMLNLSTTIN